MGIRVGFASLAPFVKNGEKEADKNGVTRTCPTNRTTEALSQAEGEEGALEKFEGTPRQGQWPL